jgi:hypothetical protein
LRRAVDEHHRLGATAHEQFAERDGDQHRHTERYGKRRAPDEGRGRERHGSGGFLHYTYDIFDARNDPSKNHKLNTAASGAALSLTGKGNGWRSLLLELNIARTAARIRSPTVRGF